MTEAVEDSYIRMVRRVAHLRPEATALLIGDDRRTYGALLDNAGIRARELKVLGLGAGDRLGILMPTSVDFVEIMIGAAMIGVVTVPMNTRFKTIETRHIIVDSGMAAIYTTDAIDDVVNFAELLASALPGLETQTDAGALAIDGVPGLRAIVQIGAPRPAFVEAAALRDRALALPLPDEGEAPAATAPFLLMYTSGTTANPKACILSSRAFLSTAARLAERYAIGERDIWWCPLPMFHVGGIIFMSLVLSRGGFYIGMRHFTPDAAFDLVERFRPTVLYPLFPPITLAIMDHPRFAKADFGSARYVFSVAPPDVQMKIQTAFPTATLCSAFGLTEACGAVTFSPPDDSAEDRLTTCGTPLPGWDVRIVDPETQQPAGPGQPGEIEIRGVGLFDGYFGDAGLTAAAFTPDGFCRTGDIGSVDPGGRLRFHGRFKDQLKVGGENVSALEVESFLCSHPAVKQAQVVGAPDERYGEVVAAFIELMSGAELSADDVLAYCAGKIARYKIPRYLRFVQDWPMSATKVQKHRLRDRIAAELAAGHG
ncbi:class I adenylate-forming enzyme family protein [Chelatococcus asaccharovorans]|uniref:Fatty-acyl-CoA synthase n=1 Tax=Chelatococcus asaccharovorans TaxID=28210 RepID=A0A2V3UIL9_9HYPH|nr:class I adenylate-forming enzyme family protein [Chelatococcus asaccharovorans]MBS7706206.1 acyl--CoA ligase [Chelatococcus asaccharovorans]PXW65161.1 fatty-acyl-CoA synthase [Chelatococcus asaccharovorans]